MQSQYIDIIRNIVTFSSLSVHWESQHKIDVATRIIWILPCEYLKALGISKRNFEKNNDLWNIREVLIQFFLLICYFLFVCRMYIYFFLKNCIPLSGTWINKVSIIYFDVFVLCFCSPLFIRPGTIMYTFYTTKFGVVLLLEMKSHWPNCGGWNLLPDGYCDLL